MGFIIIIFFTIFMKVLKLKALRIEQGEFIISTSHSFEAQELYA